MADIQPLLDWLSIDSTTGREAEYLTALEGVLEDEGLALSRQEVESGRWNLLATPDGPAEVLLCTHVDTVPPFFGPTVEEGQIRGRGACDTKGGLFSMWRAYQALDPDDKARTGFLLLVGEEVDHIGAIVAAEKEYPDLKAMVLGEPTRNRLATGQKGVLKAMVRCVGRAGHSAFPDSGHSAIHDLVALLDELLAHPWPTHETLGPTTLNVGIISGGAAHNVIAPTAEAAIMFRTVTPRAELEKQLRAVIGDRAEVEVTTANDPASLCHWPTFKTDVVPFNTDAPYLLHQAPIVLAGPGDIRVAHSLDEHIALDDIAEGTELYRQLVSGLLDGSLAT